MKRLLLAAAPIAALLLPGWAAACMMDPLPEALMHSALPGPLPPGAIVAEVEASPDATDFMLSDGLRVVVHRMIQGPPTPILILQEWPGSCVSLFGNGRRGLVLAIPAGRRRGLPVAMPIWAQRRHGYRLPDGYRLPPLPLHGRMIDHGMNGSAASVYIFWR